MWRGAWLAAAAFLAAATGHAGPLVHQRTIVAPAGAHGDLFGGAVVVGRGSLVVGASGGDAAAVDAGAAWLVDAWSGTARALEPDAPLVAGARFGHAVAAASGVVAVAAPQLAGPAARAGSVLLFDEAGAPRGAVAAEAGAGAQLGASLAMVEGLLVAGAPLAADGEGRVHLVDPATATTRRTLESPDAAPYDLFGAAVAAGAGRVVVAEPLDDGAAANAGAVHVFDATGEFLWTRRSPKASAGDLFGAAVAMVGSDVLVGAPFDDGAAADGGAAYLFDGATGALRRRIDDPGPRRDGRFGASVAAHGPDLLVAAPFVDGGVVHLLDALGRRLDTLAAPGGEAGEQFGMAVASDGALVVVGAWLADAGAVHVFRDPGASPPPTTTSSASTTSTSAPTTTTVTETSSSTATSVSTTSTTTSSTTTTSAPAAEAPTTTTVAVAPGTSTSTTAGSGSVLPPTSTTTVPGEALPCDDGDACTVDRTDDGRCGSLPVPGVGGARCRLTMLGALLAGVPDPAGGGRRTRALLRRRVDAAARLVEVRRLLGARREIRRIVATIARAGRRGRMLPAVADAARALAEEALARLADRDS